MKTKLSLLITIGLSTILLSSCSTKSSYRVYHPNVTPENYSIAFEKDKNECEMQAYQVVQMPRTTSYSRPSYSSSVPDAGSILSGYESARNDPANIYRERINSYKNACLKSKGWQLIKQ